MLEHDEGIRRGGTMEALAALPSAASWDPALAPDITAGNASQMSDGAAAMLIADRRRRRGAGLAGACRRSATWSSVVTTPCWCCRRRIPVTRKLLARSGMTIDDFDAIECNEAFAAIALDVGPRVRARPAIATTRAAARSPSVIRSARQVSG